jgi:hypothetical protein
MQRGRMSHSYQEIGLDTDARVVRNGVQVEIRHTSSIIDPQLPKGGDYAIQRKMG